MVNPFFEMLYKKVRDFITFKRFKSQYSLYVRSYMYNKLAIGYAKCAFIGYGAKQKMIHIL